MGCTFPRARCGRRASTALACALRSIGDSRRDPGGAGAIDAAAPQPEPHRRSTAMTQGRDGLTTAMEEDTPVRSNRVGDELKNVAQDVLRLGAQCVQAGRTWLDDRRNEMAQRSNEDRDDQDRSRYGGRSDGDRGGRGRGSGPSGPSQFAGDYQTQGTEQNRDNARDDHRMWGGQQASYAGARTQDRQQFAGGAEQAYFGQGGRDEGYGGRQGHGYGQGQGYGSEGAQGYGDYGGSQTYGGTVNSYGGGSQPQFGRGQGYGAQGQGRGQGGYGPDRGYGAQGYYSGSQSEAQSGGQDRGYGSTLHGRGTGAGYGQGRQGYDPDERSQQLQGDYGQQGQQFGRNRDHYARSGLGNETIGQGRIGGYGAIGDREGYGADAYGGPSMGQGFGTSSGYGIGGSGYAQRYGYRDDDEGAMQFGGQQQSHRGRGPKNYSRSDERIVEDINERLTHADDIDASDIEVRCESGKVTLEGTVDHRWMKHRAEDIADACAGVKDVDNRISVRSARGHGAEDDASQRQSTQQTQGRNGGGKESREGKESPSTGGTSATGGSSQQH